MVKYMTKLDEALGLFPSVIKCGEQWSPRCQSVLNEAKAELVTLRAKPQYLSGCLRDGVCRGVCVNTDCPNHDMVVAARVCVFPKEDGVLYPDSAQQMASTKQTISMVPVISNSKWEP